MKAIACFVLLSAILATGLLAQTKAYPAATPEPHPMRISARTAEKLLVHKAEIFCLPIAGSRVSGTVVVTIEIDRNGNVLHPTVVSGPAMLQQLVLDLVTKYRYKPYLLNGKAVDVETTVSVVVNGGHGCSPNYTIH